ncbi:MAG: sulfurtransferase TusA family protein [Actinobacteria bacterium]|nr:sulfurtransferase TusA family protein [Actinomycetota bacterium]
MTLKTIDCRGMRCPLPIIETAKVIRVLLDGEKFLLLSDDPATQTDLIAWARMTGHHVEIRAAHEFIVTANKGLSSS